MRKIADKNKPSVVGRTKAVIVLESETNPVGIISEIVVRASSDDSADRLVFRGAVDFEARSKRHLNSTVLPVVDKIIDHFDLPRRNFEISVVNLAATASKGIGIEIAGFSADLPILLAFLSSAIQVAIRQDVVSTGHIGSLEGDIVPVRGIPAKIDAVLAMPEAYDFVLPDLERDKSLQVLTPVEYQSAKESLLSHKGELKTHSVSGLDDAIRIFMTDESIALGSLKSGFYNAKVTVIDSGGPLSKSIVLLAEGNEKRFWDALEHSLLDRSADKARLLVQTYADFHVKNQTYPENFGESLSRLVISLPPPTRKMKNLFPLLSMDLCIKLSQCAKERDHDDVRRLYKVAFGEGLRESSDRFNQRGAFKSSESDRENELLEMLLAELSEENLSEKIGQPIDKARLRYANDAIMVKDGHEFNEAISAFYAHLFRHTCSPAGHVRQAAFSAEALNLVSAAFRQIGGYKAALAEGKYGTNGGMRMVFDAMTEYLKVQETEKYINSLFKESLDALDWDEQVRLIEVFRERVGPVLPAELRDLPAERLASRWDEIIGCYAESMGKVSDLMKRL